MTSYDMSSIRGVNEVVSAIRAAAQDLEADVYEIDIRQYPSAEAPGVGVDQAIAVELRSKLHPEETAALRAWLYEDGDRVWITIGEDSLWEVPFEPGWRPTGLATLAEEVTALARAVIEGEVAETVWYIGDTIERAEGRVRIKGREHATSSVHGGAAAREPKDAGRSRREFDYRPYARYARSSDVEPGV